MILELPREELGQLLQKQIANLFLLRDDERSVISDSLDTALRRSEFCFSFSRNKYFRKNGQTYFNPFHSGQYAIFLYFVSNTIFHSNPESRLLADRIYYLNKCLNGIDLFYEVNMPKVFSLGHPVGTVLGRAKYGEYFGVSQNCTVGNSDGKYPVFGSNVKLMAGSMVLGSCNIGDNVIFSANSYTKDTDVPPCSVVFGSVPNLIIKREESSYFNRLGGLDHNSAN